ncbi:MAG: hypothetical protein OHK0039_04600 [Bacteroidia bacterium]
MLLTAILLLMHLYPGNAYYLSDRGDDSGPGTRRHPWRTLARASQATLGPGDALYLRGGDTFAGMLVLDSADAGQAGAPVTVASYGPGRATIDAGAGTALWIDRTSHVQVRDLVLRGAGRKTGNRQAGMWLRQAADIAVEDVEVYGFQKAGVEMYECARVRLLRVYAHDNGFAGISSGGAYGRRANRQLYVGYCRAENNPGDPSNLDNHSGNGIVLSEVDTALIEYCVATGNGWDMPRQGNGPVGIWVWNAHAAVIQHCIAHHNRTAPGAADGGGFDLDGGVTASVIQYCLSYENDGTGYGLFQFEGALPWVGNTVRYCISENDGQTGKPSVLLWNGSSNPDDLRGCELYHNVFRNDSGAVVGFLDDKHRDFFFRNNIFIGPRALFQGSSMQVRYEGNLWWTGVADSLPDPAAVRADPAFVHMGRTTLDDPTRLAGLPGYRLRPDSPARGAGVDLRARGIDSGTRDFFGQQVPGGDRPHIGIDQQR